MITLGHRPPPGMAGRPPNQPGTPLDRVRAGFAGADPDGFLDVGYKYLAIADAARLGRAADRLDRRSEVVVRNDDLDLHFGQEVDDVFGPAIKLCVPLLAAEALRFEDGDALDS